jgi:hypothetical protein
MCGMSLVYTGADVWNDTGIQRVTCKYSTGGKESMATGTPRVKESMASSTIQPAPEPIT